VERSGLEIKGDNGLGEWYGLARFTHPSPATPTLLSSLFPAYNMDYKPSIIPYSSGESVPTLHNRCAYALEYIISHEDATDEESRAILICTHAASMIAIGRALTGHMPEDICEDDFKTHTCGISKFVRRLPLSDTPKYIKWEKGTEIPAIEWRDRKGVAGGWDCVINSNCGHLDGGEERHWYVS
jgi:transcription factor C subunit 7